MDNEQLKYLRFHELTCKHVEALLDVYIENTIIPELREKVDAHLSICDECLCLIDDCKCILEIAKTLDEPLLPAGPKKRLREALRERTGYNISGRNNLTLLKS